MDFLYVLLIAVALGADAFSVAIGVGTYLKVTNRRQRFRLSFHFGLFQFLMPILGWFAGYTIESYISAVDHWIVLIILSFIGGKMIYDSIWSKEESINTDVTKGIHLVILSIATSIDALAVGFSIALIKEEIIFPSIIIGIVAYLMTIIGIFIGEKASAKLGNKAALLGGIVLVIIGVKVFLEHLGVW